MVSRKYVRDYKLSETVTERGHIRTEAVYMGGDYFLTAPLPALKKLSRASAAGLSAAWIGFLAALLPSTLATHTMYVILPHAFCALPLFLLTESALRLRAAPGPYTRRQAEQLEKSTPVRAAFSFALALAALVGLAVAALLPGAQPLPGDGLFAAGDAAILAGSAAIFARRALFRTEKRGA